MFGCGCRVHISTDMNIFLKGLQMLHIYCHWLFYLKNQIHILSFNHNVDMFGITARGIISFNHNAK